MASVARPAALALALGAWVAQSTCEWTADGVILGLVGGLGGCLVLGRRTRRGGLCAVVALAAVAGLVRGGASRTAPVPDADPPSICRVTGVVVTRGVDRTAADGEGRETRFSLDLDVPAPRGAIVTVRRRSGAPPPAVLPGDRVAIVGKVTLVRPPTNPGERDVRGRLLRKGIAYRVRTAGAGAVRHLSSQGVESQDTGVQDTGSRGSGRSVETGLAWGIRRLAARGREAVLRRVRAAAGEGPSAALLGCLLVGDRSGISEELREDFRRAGAAHLLAVSGLHLVLLVGALVRLVSWIAPWFARSRLALPSLLTVLVVYCGLCAFSTPVIRASIFVAVTAVARRAGRRARVLDHLCLAALLILCVEPRQVLDTGFHLSFVAVAGLTLLTPRFREALFAPLALLERFPEAVSPARLAVYRFVAAGVSAGLAAQAATTPIVAASFGEMHPFSFVSNLVAVPLTALALPSAAVLAVLGGLAPSLTAPFADLVTWPLSSSVSGLATLPLSTVSTGPLPIWTPWVGLGLLATAACMRRWTVLHLVLPLVAVALPALVRPPSPCPTGPEMVILDVGHGQAILARTPRGRILLDVGSRAPGTAERVVVPALRALGVRHLDALWLSHEDADHCGAAVDVLDAVAVDEVVVPFHFGVSRLARSLLRVCHLRGVPVTRVARGDVWERGGMRLRVLHPRPGQDPGSRNEGSAVIHFEAGALRVLLPGDVQGAPLRALTVDPGLPRADFLLLPHHGLGPVGPQADLFRRAGASWCVASAPAKVGSTADGATGSNDFDVRDLRSRTFGTGDLGAILLRPGAPPRSHPQGRGPDRRSKP